MSHSIRSQHQVASHETPGTKFFPPFEVTPELEAAADECISHYPASKRSAMLPLLHLVQHQFGFISAAAIEWVADKLDLEPIQVLEVVTFYPGFRQSAPGKFHIRVCRTLSCAMGGSYELMDTPVRTHRHRPLALRSAPPPDRRLALRQFLGRIRRVPRLLRHRPRVHGQR